MLAIVTSKMFSMVLLARLLGGGVKVFVCYCQQGLFESVDTIFKIDINIA